MIEEILKKKQQSEERQKELKQVTKNLSQTMMRGIQKYNMINDGDKILVACSGGKDSMTMLYLLSQLRKAHNKNFTIKAVHVLADFAGCPIDLEIMKGFFERWDVEYEILEVPVVGRLKEGKSMNCYWCSTQRRLEIFQYAEQHQFNKIAFGHHLDDILQTFFMNMTQKGTLSAMLPVLKFDKYPQIIIRPLALVHEVDIQNFTDLFGLKSMVMSFDCPFGVKSNRKVIEAMILKMTNGNKRMKDMIFKSLEAPDLRYLLIEENFKNIESSDRLI